jgi:hypothetical protein
MKSLSRSIRDQENNDELFNHVQLFYFTIIVNAAEHLQIELRGDY